MRKRRKGFSMIESLWTIVMLAVIVAGVTASSIVIRAMEANTKNTVYLSIHNLNCMERLRQECLANGAGMLQFYDDTMLGSTDIETVAHLEHSSWDHFNIYEVRIESKVRDSKHKLVSEYVITDIGGVSFDESFN